MKRTMDEALAVARHDRPERLPSGFADGVMQRIAEASVEYRVPLVIATRLGFLTTAAVAVLSAALIGHSGRQSMMDEGPPRMMDFGLDGGLSSAGRP